MTYHSNLSQLRFGLSKLYAALSREHHTTTPGLHHLLLIPLKERLILLATIDGASDRDIRSVMRVSKDNAKLASRRMKRTMHRLKQYLADPHQHVPEVWTRADLTPDQDLTNGLILQEPKRGCLESSLWQSAGNPT